MLGLGESWDGLCASGSVQFFFYLFNLYHLTGVFSYVKKRFPEAKITKKQKKRQATTPLGWPDSQLSGPIISWLDLRAS